MSATPIKHLPKSLRFGSTILHYGYSTGETAEPDGVRRISSQCVELETFANFNQTGSVFFIGMSIVCAVGFSIFITCLVRYLTPDFAIDINKQLEIIFLPWLLVIFGLVNYFASGAHRSRGAFIRIHRGTRKLYYIFPGKKHLHILDWDRLEILAGYVPIVTGSVNTSRHPLYLIGVDYSLAKPAEVCVACGNLGLFDGDRSAKSLWEYLQRFMDYGPQGLPEPPPASPSHEPQTGDFTTLSRMEKRIAQQPFHPTGKALGADHAATARALAGVGRLPRVPGRVHPVPRALHDIPERNR